MTTLKPDTPHFPNYTAFVGLDLSLNGTGIAAVNRQGSLILNQTLKPSKLTSKIKGPEFRVARLIEIRNRLDAIILNIILKNSSNNLLFAVEGYTYATANSAHVMGELGGVVRTMLYEHRFDYIEVSPSHVKKYATGAGNAKKEQVIAHVLKRWGLLFSTSDEADAYVLARMVRDWMSVKSDTAEQGALIQCQFEVLDKLGEIIVKV